MSLRICAPSVASANPSIVNVAGDIGEPDTAERIMKEGAERFGRLDTLVNA